MWLMVMGDGQSHRDFFAEYLRIFGEDGDQLVTVDSKGVLNAIEKADGDEQPQRSCRNRAQAHHGGVAGHGPRSNSRWFRETL